MTQKHIFLNDRAIITLEGPERKKLLQGLITADINKLKQGQGLYAALLSAQGKYLHDFFLSEWQDILFLDCEKERLPDLLRRLMMYRLRSDVEITDQSEKYHVLSCAMADSKLEKIYADPRHPAMGYRAIVTADKDQTAEYAPLEKYDEKRLALGLCDGSRDLEVDKTFILEANMMEMHGIDFEKGCFIGQEVAARMRYRASLKKRILPVEVNGPLPPPDTPILDEDQKKIGHIRSGRGQRAMAYLRLDRMEFDKIYFCGPAKLTPLEPDWLKEASNG